MVNTCVLCRRSSGANKTLGFHRFPLLRPEVLQKWVEAVNVEGFQATKGHRICSDHFEDENFFQLGERKYLKEDAFPTLYLSHKERFLLKTQKKSDLNPEISHKSAEKQQKSEEIVNTCVLCRRNSWTCKKLSFHRFPFLRPKVLQKWVEAVEVGFQATTTHTICSTHFMDEDFYFGPGGQKHLKEHAFPTLFLCQEEQPNATKETTDLSTEETADSPEDSDISANSQSNSFQPNKKIKVLHQASQENNIQQVNIETTSYSENSELTAKSTKKSLRKKVKNLQAQLRRREKKIADLKHINFLLRKRNKKLLQGYGKSLQCIF